MPTGNAFFQQGPRSCRCRRQDQIQSVADDRVLPTDEPRVFARQRLIAVEGDGSRPAAGPEVRHQHMVRRRQHDQAVAAVFLIDADDVEQVEREAHQVDVVILLGDGGGQRLGFVAAVECISSRRSRPCSSCAFN